MLIELFFGFIVLAVPLFFFWQWVAGKFVKTSSKKRWVAVAAVFIPEKTRPLGADNKIVFSGMKLGAVVTAPRNFINDSQNFISRLFNRLQLHLPLLSFFKK